LDIYGKKDRFWECDFKVVGASPSLISPSWKLETLDSYKKKGQNKHLINMVEMRIWRNMKLRIVLSLENYTVGIGISLWILSLTYDMMKEMPHLPNSSNV